MRVEELGMGEGWGIQGTGAGSEAFDLAWETD